MEQHLMDNELFGILLIAYFIYTTIFTVIFYRENNAYSRKQKSIHLLLIWLLPILWIFILNYTNKATPGSSHYSKKRKEKTLEAVDGDSPFHESGAGF